MFVEAGWINPDGSDPGNKSATAGKPYVFDELMRPRCITGSVTGNKSDADDYDDDPDYDDGGWDEPKPVSETSDTLDRKSLLFYGLLVFVAGIALGVLIGTGTLGENKIAQIPAGPPPDYTVANCELWSTDTAPVLPPYTVANACLTDDEMISW